MEELIGDGGIVYANPKNTFPYQVKTVVESRFLENYHSLEGVRKHGIPFLEAWESLSLLTLDQYIYLRQRLPIALKLAGLINLEAASSDHFKLFESHYTATSAWLASLLDYNARIKKPVGIDQYLPYARVAKARLDLAQSVYLFRDEHWYREWLDEDGKLHPPFFRSGAHLWFWGEVSGALRYVQATGLTYPLPPCEVTSKEFSLTEWRKAIKELRGLPDKRCQSWRECVESIDLQYIGRAQKGQYLTRIDESDPLEQLIKAERYLTQIIRSSEHHQIVATILTLEGAETYVSGKGKKLPKERKPNKGRGRPLKGN